ncbi:MAG: hypothetical protein ABIJ39_08855 [Chloroflexota bacterium]
MNRYNLKPERSSNANSLIWNILTGVMLLGVLCLGGFFLSIFINPYQAFNPFPPAPLPTLVQYPTATSTLIPRAATWTPSPTIVPLPTRTRAPEWTPIPSNTPFSLGLGTQSTGEGDTTLTPGPTSTSMPVTVNISYLNSTTYHPDSACNWMGVAGLAVDKNNNPILYLTVHLSGMLNDQQVDYYSLTGTATNYGPSGFEFVLGNQPVASTGTIWIQLLDGQSNLPLTEKVYIDTYNDCERNLVLIRFQRIR